MDTERYLSDLEERIDPQAEDRLWAEWAAFSDGRFSGDIFSPRRTAQSPARVEWPSVRVNESLEDFDKMALQQLGDCSRMVASGDGRLLCVRCNYGTGILPSLFGAELFMMDDETNTLPTTRPLPGGAAAMRALLDRGVPDLRAGLGGRVFEMAERFVEIGRRHPKIGRYVHVYHPDIQGPMDICELLWGSGLFVDVVDEPELVKRLLALVTETYTRFMREWDRIVPSPDGHAVHWSLMHRGRIMLRDDSAMNFSPRMFDEFIRPWDNRLLAEFGGGAIHFCGRGDHWIDRLGQMPGAYAINLSQPHLNDMEAVFRSTVDRGINLIGLDRGAATAALSRGRDLRGRVHCY
jgi:hypothetical protein